jgi:hypothetical protein
MLVQPQETVGIVTTTITIANLVDEILAERGLMPAEAIRSLTIEKVLVDMGTTRLCLPADVIAQLGLPLAGEIDVRTATGVSQARLFKRVKLCASLKV